MEKSGDILDVVFPVDREVEDAVLRRLLVEPGVSQHHHVPASEPDFSLIDDSNKRARAAKAAKEAAAAD